MPTGRLSLYVAVLVSTFCILPMCLSTAQANDYSNLQYVESLSSSQQSSLLHAKEITVSQPVHDYQSTYRIRVPRNLARITNDNTGTKLVYEETEEAPPSKRAKTGNSTMSFGILSGKTIPRIFSEVKEKLIMETFHEEDVDDKKILIGRNSYSTDKITMMVGVNTGECERCNLLVQILADDKHEVVEFWAKYARYFFETGYPNRVTIVSSRHFDKKGIKYGNNYSFGDLGQEIAEQLNEARRKALERNSQGGGSQSNVTRSNQSSACPKFRENRDICYQRWNNIGGGSSGQAGAFKECYETYNNAMIAAGC
ncbi:hypothetical protein [Methylobacterium oxalidis]|uniref:Lipoprotein n=1 Tax=Methylobacterium oxalidis TaxID=944322 RepID=A0A512J7U3_9HYPH|nr:hypothetical protein [Methylobacterium oxalidis]GEP06036.1 hypothetical protein MOX02_40740 [Methylobacterium oxalidis]GJE35697.1 hypothetical protein LDDCCGHA_5917 [Methylobacterium oxalidis]GLS65755.1 hypothetical protein GCM10007888_41370 [Methylobacterium oxalidis]